MMVLSVKKRPYENRHYFLSISSKFLNKNELDMFWIVENAQAVSLDLER